MAEQFQVTTDPEIEPDDVHYHDSDSAYNDSLESESYRTSITSSVLNYKYENGRRYHVYREGEYALPNDEEEQDRMDLLHHIYSLILDGEIHLAPIKNPQRVLDIGTGTGIWAVDFADQYQSSEVIGNDLSPIQPRWVPPNCQFEIDDFESEWSYAHPFDYIHGRELAGSIHDFPRLCKQAFAHLHPGGFFEIQSFTVDIFSDDGSIEKAPYTKQVVSLVQEASAKFGKPMDNVDTWPAAMKEAGFTDVVCKIVKAPSSPWAKDPKQKEIGRFFQAHQVHSVPAYTNVLLSKVLGWSKTEIDILNMHVLRESKNLDVHQYGKLYLIYGRKPL
ncbi:S-adenosyl-L-methionine-dependent methyltransferase [Aspergillus minisclerotigenes]|uniref:S-adenosyl-L-methionine-dependent methyltransferase n=1 Tax=Aspergillus minisclerotigenes TaxID=656917 RepID=A0A5N6IW41_9EURO|nr:S-adenosyl-L-methionine-dependent methyltransferase [Aspergillus minisclerotigenes]